MVNPAGYERRSHPRVSINVPLAAENTEGHVTSFLKDISRVGAAAIVNQRIDEMTVVYVEAKLGGGDLPQIDLADEAVIVRCDPREDGQYEIGLFFHTMPVERRDAIDYFIEQSTELGMSST